MKCPQCQRELQHHPFHICVPKARYRDIEKMRGNGYPRPSRNGAREMIRDGYSPAAQPRKPGEKQ